MESIQGAKVGSQLRWPTLPLNRALCAETLQTTTINLHILSISWVVVWCLSAALRMWKVRGCSY